MVMPKEIIIYTDGACRKKSNKSSTGPSSWAFRIYDEDDNILTEKSGFIDNTTNNRAEYVGICKALEEASKHTRKKVTVRCDSDLCVKQLSGAWRVKKEELRPFIDSVKKAEAYFAEVEYQHFRRTHLKIQEVDRLCNKILDEAGH